MLMIIDVHLQSGSIIEIGKSFHIIMFWVMYGYILKLKKNYTESYRIHIKKRIKVIMYPYFTLSMINIGICLGRAMCSSVRYNVLKKYIFNTVSFRGIGTLWFLPVMFISSIIFWSFVKKMDEKKGVMFSACCSVIAFLISFGLEYADIKETYGVLTYMYNISIVILTSTIALGFMAVGYILAGTRKYFLNCEHKNIVVLVIITCVAYMLDNKMISNYTSDLHFFKIGNPVIFVSCSMLGMIGTFCLSCLLSYSKYIGRYLGFIGRNSLIVMTTHKEFYVNYVIYIVISSFGDVNNAILGIISLIIICIVESIIILIVNNSWMKKLYKLP